MASDSDMHASAETPVLFLLQPCFFLGSPMQNQLLGLRFQFKTILCTILHYATLCKATLYHTIQHYTLLHYTRLYHAILDYTMLH